ncbi:hypothetical protein QH494_15965 [Sphingomonas sp. AR_OL41]|uniref:hypothetical protein n=1 Tax=Sphingomonas sp. AR_OL41 TaxID=3042729 RepID=UPI0024813E65|nr:hypothetical protein [Sphingomonas sp. AR_OL41]MDH7973688.1 hypothetical protein [Sphingomonas sp. AR_OL41]
MPRYLVLETSLIGNEIVEAGREVDYDGYPSGNLQPLDDEGRAKAAELIELNKQRIREMQAANPFSPTIDPEALGTAIAKAVGEAMASLVNEQADLRRQLDEANAALEQATAPAADAGKTAKGGKAATADASAAGAGDGAAAATA